MIRWNLSLKSKHALSCGLMASASISLGCAKSAVQSGTAIGQVGGGLSSHARDVPQGYQACALDEALERPAPGAKEEVSEACAEARQKDFLWQRALVALAAYSQRLSALAAGEDARTAGHMAAHTTGVKGPNWTDADAPAREAVAKLIEQMTQAEEKTDLEATVNEAAPHVKTICSGVKPYLEQQAKRFADISKEIGQKRGEGAGRRCIQVSAQTVCVPESMTDRLVYALTFGDVTAQERNHYEALDAVTGFCAAHEKLASAASEGNADSDETYAAMIEAVKLAPRSSKPPPAPPAASPAGEGGTQPAK